MRDVWFRRVGECPRFISEDGTDLCELLHPGRPEARDLPVGFSIAHARLAPEKSSIPHRLRQSCEIYYILEVRGTMHVDETIRDMEPGDIVYIPPGALQWIENTSRDTLAFLALVCPPWREEGQEVLPSRNLSP